MGVNQELSLSRLQEKMAVGPKHMFNGMQVGGTLQCLFSSRFLGSSKRKLFSNGNDSLSSGCTDSTHDTRSITLDDVVAHCHTKDDDKQQSYDYEFAIPDHDDHFVHTTDLKLAGIKWKRPVDSERYAQLNFVPEDTIILVRRAPERTRSSRRIQHSSTSKIDHEGLGSSQHSLTGSRHSTSSRRSRHRSNIDRSTHATTRPPTRQARRRCSE